MAEIQKQVEALVRKVDEIRALKLVDKAEETRRIREVEAEIRKITGPRRLVGKGKGGVA